MRWPNFEVTNMNTYTHTHTHTQLLLLLLLALIPLVRGAYELRVMAHSYSNPSHRHARGGCCDNLFYCHNHCDNYFVFCLRSASYSHATWTCPLGERHTGEVGGDSLTFRSQIGSQQNPMLFSNSGNWPVSSMSQQRWHSIATNSQNSCTLLVCVLVLHSAQHSMNTYTASFCGSNTLDTMCLLPQNYVVCHTISRVLSNCSFLLGTMMISLALSLVVMNS